MFVIGSCIVGFVSLYCLLMILLLFNVLGLVRLIRNDLNFMVNVKICNRTDCQYIHVNLYTIIYLNTCTVQGSTSTHMFP